MDPSGFFQACLWCWEPCCPPALVLSLLRDRKWCASVPDLCFGLQLCKHLKLLHAEKKRPCVFTPFPYTGTSVCGPCDKQIEELNWIKTSCFFSRLVSAGVSCSMSFLMPAQRRAGRAAPCSPV